VDRRPNILFIIVDELRYWRVFPEGINNVGQFLHQFMRTPIGGCWSPASNSPDTAPRIKDGRQRSRAFTHRSLLRRHRKQAEGMRKKLRRIQ